MEDATKETKPSYVLCECLLSGSLHTFPVVSCQLVSNPSLMPDEEKKDCADCEAPKTETPAEDVKEEAPAEEAKEETSE